MSKKIKNTKQNATKPEPLPMVSQYGCATYIMITSRFAAVKKILNYLRSKGYNKDGIALIEQNLKNEFSAVQREMAVLANVSPTIQQALCWELDELTLLQAEEMNKAFLAFESGKIPSDLNSTLPLGTLKFVHGLYCARKARAGADNLPVTYYLPAYYNTAVAVKGYGQITIQHLVGALYGDVLRQYEKAIDTPELLEKFLHIGISIHALFTEEANAYPSTKSFDVDKVMDGDSKEALPFIIATLIELIEGHRLTRDLSLESGDVEMIRTGLELLFIAHYGAQKGLAMEETFNLLQELIDNGSVEEVKSS